jgi:hypothetical protein
MALVVSPVDTMSLNYLQIIVTTSELNWMFRATEFAPKRVAIVLNVVLRMERDIELCRALHKVRSVAECSSKAFELVRL